MKSKTLNILKQEYRMAMSYELSHAVKFLSLALGGVITTLLFCILWVAGSNQGVGSVSREYVISYFLLVLLFTRLTADVSVRITMDSISRGNFSKFLVKPFSYLTEILGANLGEQTLQTLFVIPFFVAGNILFKEDIIFDMSPYTVFLAVGAVFMASIIKFLSSQIYSQLAFTVKENNGLRILYENSIIILSGEMIPYMALPSYAIPFLQVLPFRYMLSFPIEILMGGMRPYDIQFGFAVSGIWLLLLLLIYKICYAVNIKKYEAEGI